MGHRQEFVLKPMNSSEDSRSLCFGNRYSIHEDHSTQSSTSLKMFIYTLLQSDVACVMTHF